MNQDGIAPRRYGPVVISLHWLTAVLVLAAFIMGPGGSEQRVYSESRDFERGVHELLGLAVFACVLLRLVWRQFSSVPQHAPGPAWMVLASRGVQGLMYILLVVAPLTAVAGAWLEGHPLTIAWLGNIPPLIPESHAAGKVVAEIHGLLGDAIMWLAGLHAVAALFHHLVLRDGVLLSMLPRFGNGRNQT